MADQTNRRGQVFDSHDKFLAMWGEYGIVQPPHPEVRHEVKA